MAKQRCLKQFQHTGDTTGIKTGKHAEIHPLKNYVPRRTATSHIARSEGSQRVAAYLLHDFYDAHEAVCACFDRRIASLAETAHQTMNNDCQDRSQAAAPLTVDLLSGRMPRTVLSPGGQLSP